MKNSLKKNWWKWLLGIIAFIFIFPFILMKISPEFARKVEENRVKKAMAVKAAEKTGPMTAEKADKILKDKGLSLCEVYNWIETMEVKTRQTLEAKRPDMNAVDRIQQLEEIRNVEWKNYSLKYTIPDSMRSYVNAFGLEACK